MKEAQKEVWRPTVRYNPAFEAYVNAMFHSTTLDRNQVVRLALFVAPFSGLYLSRVDKYLRSGVASAPAPSWTPQDTPIWYTLGGEDVADTSTAEKTDSRDTFAGLISSART